MSTTRSIWSRTPPNTVCISAASSRRCMPQRSTSMGLELYMVGLVAQDIDKSLEFYRRLGVDFPQRVEGRPHVEARMSGGLTFFLNAPSALPELAGAGVIFEFYLDDRSKVDAKYNELVDYGY